MDLAVAIVASGPVVVFHPNTPDQIYTRSFMGPKTLAGSADRFRDAVAKGHLKFTGLYRWRLGPVGP